MGTEEFMASAAKAQVESAYRGRALKEDCVQSVRANRSAIDEKLDSLEKAIYGIREEVAMLTEKIRPVTIPESEGENKNCGLPVPMRSQMTARLDEIDSNAIRIGIDIRSLIQRVEL